MAYLPIVDTGPLPTLRSSRRLGKGFGFRKQVSHKRDGDRHHGGSHCRSLFIMLLYRSDSTEHAELI